jgi:predicted ATP-binding protein involved in virulence
MIENNEQIKLQTPPPAYFGSLTIENVKCFKGKHTIDLSDKNGNPALWTVILGNNNTGKTTLLRCLAILEPEIIEEKIVSPKRRRVDKFQIGSEGKVSSRILIEEEQNKYAELENDWYYENELVVGEEYLKIGNLIIYGYSANRRAEGKQSSHSEEDTTITLFDNKLALIDVQEWLIGIYGSINEIHQKQRKKKRDKEIYDEQDKYDLDMNNAIINRVKTIFTSGLLPDVKDVHHQPRTYANDYLEVETDYGRIKLDELGYGYQITVMWIIDLIKKLFERYPNSENPLHEPAIVLIDELDLHLHPEWQRKIIKFLSEQFPKTQFIATTHSPLIVQSADNINLILLEKEEDHVIIKQPGFKTYKGWTIEEILEKLMALDGKTLSNDYLALIEQFENAVRNDDYGKAKKLCEQLENIIHPDNPQRVLFKIQMSKLIRN